MKPANRKTLSALSAIASLIVSSTVWSAHIDLFSKGDFLLEASSPGDVDSITQENTVGTPGDSWTRTTVLTNTSNPSTGDAVFFSIVENSTFEGFYAANGGSTGNVVITYLDFMDDFLNNPTGVPGGELWTQVDLMLGDVGTTTADIDATLTDADGTTGTSTISISGVSGAFTVSLPYADFLASASGGSINTLNLQNIVEFKLRLAPIEGSALSITDARRSGSSAATAVPLPGSIILLVTGLAFCNQRKPTSRV